MSRSVQGTREGAGGRLSPLCPVLLAPATKASFIPGQLLSGRETGRGRLGVLEPGLAPSGNERIIFRVGLSGNAPHPYSFFFFS